MCFRHTWPSAKSPKFSAGSYSRSISPCFPLRNRAPRSYPFIKQEAASRIRDEWKGRPSSRTDFLSSFSWGIFERIDVEYYAAEETRSIQLNLLQNKWGIFCWKNLLQNKWGVFSWKNLLQNKWGIFCWKNLLQNKWGVFSWKNLLQNKWGILSWKNLLQNKWGVLNWKNLLQKKWGILSWKNLLQNKWGIFSWKNLLQKKY